MDQTPKNEGTGDSELAREWRTHLWDFFGPLAGLIVIWCLFALVEPLLTSRPTFATWGNTQNILLQTAVVGIAALGATLIIIAGGIDLSVGSNIALVTVVIALLLNQGVNPLLAAVGGVTTGALCGVAVGSIVIGHVGRVAALVLGGLTILWMSSFGWPIALPTGLGAAALLWYLSGRLIGCVPLTPFIVTLGMWGALRGVAKGLADNRAVYTSSTWLNDLMRLPQPIDESWWQTLIAPWKWWYLLSPGVWAFMLLAALLAGLLRYTRFGRHIFAIGSNPQTARLCGIDVPRTKLLIYTVALALAGLAGVMQYSFVITGDPSTAAGYELNVIAAVVIGGGSLMGGAGTIRGTVVGALLMTVVDNGCTKIGLENWVQEILTGAIIVAAVTLDQWRHGKSSGADR